MLTKIQNHLDSYDYDIRKSHSGRWIDQKCTIDIISTIADCILQYVGEDPQKCFTVKDIWFSEFSINHIQKIFVKPDPSQKSKHEYDKLFGQPMKLLGYSRILNETKGKNSNVYSINNLEILRFIATRDRNSLDFMNLYITKVLSDSGILNEFEKFFYIQTSDAYKSVKDSFYRFTQCNTPINGDTECGRIFAKVVNVLAFCKGKCGTVSGRISKELITYDELLYNRKNWRDENSKKPKNVSRSDYPEQTEDLMTSYKIQKAKRKLNEFNMKYRNGCSEMLENNIYESGATQMHHIFPAAAYPTIADYLENLIALTPNQHFLKAHPDNNTAYIDKDYQYLCLICKAGHIKENLESITQEHIYVFSDYMNVLNTGFETKDFDCIKENDFYRVITMIDQMNNTRKCPQVDNLGSNASY